MPTNAPPISTPPSGRLARRWSLFFAGVAAVYLFIPVARPLRRWLAGMPIAGGVSLRDVVVGLLALTALGIIVFLVPRILGRRRGRGGRVASWLAVGLLLAGLNRSLLPVEWFHMVENSLVSLLALWTLGPHFPAVETAEGARRDDGVHLVAAALAGCVGVINEIIQWWMPSRVWDLRDIGVNVLVVVVVQILAWRGVERGGQRGGQRGGRGTVSLRALRWAARGWAVIAFLVLLCVSNTPQRIAAYRDLLPGGAHLGRGQYTLMKLPQALDRRWAQAILAFLTLAPLLAARRLAGRAASADR